MGTAKSRPPILMRRVPSFERARKVCDFWWLVGDDGERTLHVLLPCELASDQMVAGCRIAKDAWHWDGDSDRPTLKPSVRCTSDAGVWHGFIRDGFLVAA